MTRVVSVAHGRQLLLTEPAGPAPSFENFHRDAAPEAWARLSSWPLAPTPVLLWGPPGVGKTHLLRALAAALTARGARGVELGAAGAELPPWGDDPTRAAVLIEDAQILDARAQHLAFKLFVEASSHAIPVIATADAPPVDLPLREDLRTRLASGLVLQLHPPSESLVRKVLREQADARGVVLGEEALNYLLTHHPRDLGHLGRLIERLDALALAEHRRAITVPLIKTFDAENTP